MYEARITYVDGHKHIVEANSIEMIKSKCKSLIESPDVYEIFVYKLEDIGFLKTDLDLELI